MTKPIGELWGGQIYEVGEKLILILPEKNKVASKSFWLNFKWHIEDKFLNERKEFEVWIRRNRRNRVVVERVYPKKQTLYIGKFIPFRKLVSFLVEKKKEEEKRAKIAV